MRNKHAAAASALSRHDAHHAGAPERLGEVVLLGQAAH